MHRLNTLYKLNYIGWRLHLHGIQIGPREGNVHNTIPGGRHCRTSASYDSQWLRWCFYQLTRQTIMVYILFRRGNYPGALFFQYAHLTIVISNRNCGSHATCTGSTRILYAWAKNAAGTRLPPSVGFRIGGTDKTRVKYLVVQVHYATKLPPGERDYTGLDLEITTEP